MIGWVNPLFAAAAMAGSSVTVVLNSLIEKTKAPPDSKFWNLVYVLTQFWNNSDPIRDNEPSVKRSVSFCQELKGIAEFL